MLTRIGLTCLAALFVVSQLNASAGQRRPSITVLASFDYPGTYLYTYPAEINDRGDIAGQYIDPDGLTRGFVRFGNGRFSPPIFPPASPGDVTGAEDVSDARTICGYFVEPDNVTTHGFFFSQGAFTQFDIEGGTYTTVVALNDVGHFVGVSGSIGGTGYLDVDGSITFFSVPGAAFTFVTSINNLDDVAGTYRIGTESTSHGFLRKASGEFIYPIDYPGSLGPFGTVVSATNNRGWLVGRYYDNDTIDHAFLFKPPNTFFSFNYPEAIGTRFNGINNRGLICGEYQDNVVGARHGFVARIQQ